MEHHPRLNQSDLIIRKPKIILGSFPPWSLTEPDFEKFETLTQKEFERIKNRDFPFFYGSYVNRFWNWYQKFIDEAISKEDLDSIQKSLKEKSIGITDVIISCTRKDRSALDKHLTNRTYNHQFFKYPEKGETIKILCTSKGVMNEMLLNKSFFQIHPNFKINIVASNTFQKQIIQKTKGDLNAIKHPFYRVIEIESGGKIECISIPSPGSPYRRLIDFGCNTKDTDTFLNKYLKIAFYWFNS